MRIAAWMAAALVAVGTTGVAKAQITDAPAGQPTARKHDFEPSRIEGQLLRPSVQIFLVPHRPQFASLVQLRSHFAPELDRSVSDL